MWTPTTREQHSRKALRYQTDLTDAEWVVIEPHLPPAHGTGRPRSWPMREIVNGIFYVMRAGCPWRLLPSDLPPWGTIYRWFAKFRDDGLLEKINHSLVMADRERAKTGGRSPEHGVQVSFLALAGGIGGRPCRVADRSIAESGWAGPGDACDSRRECREGDHSGAGRNAVREIDE